MICLFNHLFVLICFHMFCVLATGLLCNSMLSVESFCTCIRGDARNSQTGMLINPTQGLKYGFQGAINAKNLRNIVLIF